MNIPSASDRLPMRWAVILLSALLVALLTGTFTFAETSSWPAALLAGLTVAGVTIPAMHQILAV
jgi:hypothetical protein